MPAKSLLSAVLVTLLALSCGGGSDEADVQESQLPNMLPSLEDLGPDYAGYRLVQDTPYPNQQVLREAISAEGDAAALERFPRINGHIRAYEARLGPAAAHFAVNLHKDAKAAKGYHSHVEKDTMASVGKDAPNKSKLLAAQPFDVKSVGEGASGAVLHVQAPPGQTGEMFLTTVGLYRGPIIGVVSIARADSTDAKEEALRLAKLLDQRIQAVAGK